MRPTIRSYWEKLNTGVLFRKNLRRTVAVTSLLVVLTVFWGLKLTGITLAGEAFCGKKEHTHVETCFQKTLICQQREQLPDRELIYHVEEDTALIRPDAEQRELIYHVEDDTDLILPERHIHTDACYEKKLLCTLEAHTHDKTCYSDLKADLETAQDWAYLLELTGGSTTAADVVNIAQSQLGYQESERNFEVDADLNRHGITRYGQWYGNPYGDWSAMFASFCLYYAGVEDAPVNAGPESMRIEWAAADMYRPSSEYAPRVGDVMFLRTADAAAEDGGDLVPALMTFRAAAPAANTVAIIKEVTDETVTVIQGDVNGTVTEVTYSIEDAAILGYGLVPEVSPYAMRAVPAAETTYVADTIGYSTGIFNSNRRFVIYTNAGSNYYAMNGAGKAVPVYIEGNEIYMDAGNRNDILWEISQGNDGYGIRNVGTGMYLHPHNNGANDNGVLTTGRWPSAFTASGGGALIRHTANDSRRVYAQLTADVSAFTVTRNQAEASVFRFGYLQSVTVQLDGTNGGIVSLTDADNVALPAMTGDTLVLPEAWGGPRKYAYRLQGWYDVKNNRYYPAGTEITVKEDLLFYADWVAETYDIGQMNEHVVESVSTSKFITTRLFDYNSLFNVLSTRNNYTGGDSAVWTLVDSGTVPHSGKETQNFVFIEYDDSGLIAYPAALNDENGRIYDRVTSGLYNAELAKLLFDPDTEVIGKTYLGTGDYLFQYCSDPTNTEHYGYYYYDSHYNAASYNQSDERFYIYDYLSRTGDSARENFYSDFLPLNSPYANTNGQTVKTYTYNGENGQQAGITHMQYDTGYSGGENAAGQMGTNFWFGMATEMDFYLPAKPGTRDNDGNYANQSIHGDDMVFEFTGDDDLWVLVDGRLVLDVGGIHGAESGYIDFSSGAVAVDGVSTGNVLYLEPGAHKLTMYYLERGASRSNFKLRFNISTRYSMTLRKEDVLTAHLLNGAEFSVYQDEACTIPARLWPDRESSERGDEPTNRFVVTNGVATMWGFAPGNTYYMKETRPPTTVGVQAVQGIVRVRLNNEGLPDYEVIPDHGNLTVGFTAHGFKVNEDTQEAYLVVSNTTAVNSPPTTVYVEKVWSDRVNHSGDSVTVYLLANGTQIQSVELGAENDWNHTWTNLPAQDAAGKKVQYSVREATVPGYVGIVTAIDSSGGSSGSGGGGPGITDHFEDGGTYLLQTRHGYLGANGNGLLLESSGDAAEMSGNTQWVADVHSDGTVTLTSKSGQTLYFNANKWGLCAAASPSNNTALRYEGGYFSCYATFNGGQGTMRFRDDSNVPGNVTYNQALYTADDAQPQLAFTLHRLDGSTEPEPETPAADAPGFRITNTPIGDATVSFTVHKAWDVGELGNASLYESLTVQMHLLANGEDAGLIGALNLRNGWSYTFTNLPQYDGSGREIFYSVEELPINGPWSVQYGPVTSAGSGRYQATVTNRYIPGVLLPETTGTPPYGYTLAGALILIVTLARYCGQRRRRERRRK